MQPNIDAPIMSGCQEAVASLPAAMVALCVLAASLGIGCGSQKPSDVPANSAGSAMPAASVAGTSGANAGSGPSGSAPDSSVWSSNSGARLSAEAIVLGACRLKSLNPDGADCVGLSELTSCALDQCNLAPCVSTCGDYLQCVMSADDQCVAADTCHNPQPCLDCIASALVCSSTQCAGLIKCGSSMSGGACDKLETCCKAQPDPTACLGFASAARMFSGDGFCQMLIADKGFIGAYASKVACTF